MKQAEQSSIHARPAVAAPAAKPVQEEGQRTAAKQPAPPQQERLSARYTVQRHSRMSVRQRWQRRNSYHLQVMRQASSAAQASAGSTAGKYSPTGRAADRSGKAARPCRDPEDGCSKPSGCAAGRRGQACYAYAGKPCRAGTGQTGGFAACGEGFGCIKAGFRKREGGKGTAEKCFLSEKQGDSNTSRTDSTKDGGGGR